MATEENKKQNNKELLRIKTGEWDPSPPVPPDE